MREAASLGRLNGQQAKTLQVKTRKGRHGRGPPLKGWRDATLALLDLSDPPQEDDQSRPRSA